MPLSIHVLPIPSPPFTGRTNPSCSGTARECASFEAALVFASVALALSILALCVHRFALADSEGRGRATGIAAGLSSAAFFYTLAAAGAWTAHHELNYRQRRIASDYGGAFVVILVAGVLHLLAAIAALFAREASDTGLCVRTVCIADGHRIYSRRVEVGSETGKTCNLLFAARRIW